MTGTIILCGGDNRLEPRGKCPNPLHDYPLPAGYVDAGQEAKLRLSRKWRQKRCPTCKLYGWIKPS